MMVGFISCIHKHNIMIHSIISSHLRSLNYHLVNFIFELSFIIFISKPQLIIIFLLFFKNIYELLYICLCFFSLARLNVKDHMINLLKAHFRLVFLIDKCMNLMRWYFAFNIQLNFWLNMSIINIRPFFHVQFMSMMHN
jgi:hypothetical protein